MNEYYFGNIEIDGNGIDLEQVFEDAQSMHQQEFINYYKNKI